MNTEIFEKVDAYIGDLLAREEDVLKHVIASITDAGIPHISISPFCR